MKRPRIERIPAGYAPRYPQALDGDAYRALIVPDQNARLLAAAVAAAAVSAGGTLAAQDPPAARADAVLAVLSRARGPWPFWLESTTFERRPDAQGHELVIPKIPISFGNSINGVFDAGRARRLVAELFAAYGLGPVTGHRVAEDGVEAELDVYAPDRRIGVELRGRAPEPGKSTVVTDEEPAAALDDGELAALTERGYRIHRADLQSYPLMDGDQLTPTVAYLASIVAFLEDATGGPGVDLAAILDNHRVRTALPEPAAGAGVDVKRVGERLELRADRTAEVAFTVGAGSRFERRIARPARSGPVAWTPLGAPPSPGGVVMLQFPVQGGAPIRVEQDGEHPIRVEAAGPCAFLPARFDPRAAFTVTLRVGPEPCVVMGRVELVGVRP